MKYTKPFLFVIKAIAVLILIAYAIGLFRSYDTLQASIMFIIAAVISFELIFMAKQSVKTK